MHIQNRSLIFGGAIALIGLCGCTSGDGKSQSDRTQRDAGASAVRWVVRTSDGSKSVAFDIAERNRVVAGALWIADPVTKEWLYNGAIAGRRTGNALDWTSTGGMVTFHGDLSGAKLQGTLGYMAWGGASARSFTVTMAMEGS